MKKLFLFSLGLLTFHLSKAQITNPAPYCNASFDDMQGFPVDDHINSVSFGTLNHVTNSQFAAPHYVFYNNLSVPNFTRGTSYNLRVNFTTAGGCGYGVWIDFNRNNLFETSEKVAGTTGTTFLPVGGTPSINQSVLIPASASLGNTRMRVRIVEDDNYHLVTTNELPCNASTSATDVMDWGETEDYTLNITSSVGTNEIQPNLGFLIYPNPVNQQIYLAQAPSIPITFQILNPLGQLQQSGKILPTDGPISVENLPNGIYFLQLFQQEKLVGQKSFIKEGN